MSEFPSWLWVVVAGALTLVLVPGMRAFVGWVWQKVEEKFTAIDTGIAGLRTAFDAAIAGQQRSIEALRTEMSSGFRHQDDARLAQANTTAAALLKAQGDASMALREIAELRARVDAIFDARRTG